jgi:hypothetical protein
MFSESEHYELFLTLLSEIHKKVSYRTPSTDWHQFTLVIIKEKFLKNDFKEMRQRIKEHTSFLSLLDKINNYS